MDQREWLAKVRADWGLRDTNDGKGRKEDDREAATP
jgi:hypothetical protein